MASDQLKHFFFQFFRILLLSWPLPSLHALKKWQSPAFISRILDIARKIDEKKNICSESSLMNLEQLCHQVS